MGGPSKALLERAREKDGQALELVEGGPMYAAQVASVLGWSYQLAYAVLRRLEAAGTLWSEMGPGPGLGRRVFRLR